MGKINHASSYDVPSTAEFQRFQAMEAKRRRLESHIRQCTPNAEAVPLKRQTFALPFTLRCEKCEAIHPRGMHVYITRGGAGGGDKRERKDKRRSDDPSLVYLSMKTEELGLRCPRCGTSGALRTDFATRERTGGYICVRNFSRMDAGPIAETKSSLVVDAGKPTTVLDELLSRRQMPQERRKQEEDMMEEVEGVERREALEEAVWRRLQEDTTALHRRLRQEIDERAKYMNDEDDKEGVSTDEREVNFSENQRNEAQDCTLSEVARRAKESTSAPFSTDWDALEEKEDGKFEGLRHSVSSESENSRLDVAKDVQEWAKACLRKLQAPALLEPSEESGGTSKKGGAQDASSRGRCSALAALQQYS